MPKPFITAEVSLGNILILLGVAVSMLFSYTQLRVDVNKNTIEIHSVKEISQTNDQNISSKLDELRDDLKKLVWARGGE
ncbi:MAG: hypothetical protein E2O80_01995 [Betaproteobacteria bacterium]|nr:MAG: hypothetical protein E2O80_01995 [Betaproteobacteria bacterium]